MPDKVCSACLSQGIPCLHSRTQQKRGPKLTANRTDPSQPLDTLISKILQSPANDPFHVPDDKDAVRKILFRLASYLRTIESELKYYQSRSPRESPLAGTETSPAVDTTTSLPTASEPVEQITSLPDLSKQLAGLTIGFPKKTYFGEDSNVTLIMDAMDLRNELSVEEWQSIFATTRRPQYWTMSPVKWPPLSSEPLRTPIYDFPDQNLLQSLVVLYFEEFNVYFPLLHRPTFERSIAQGLHLRDAGFGALVLVVCATATRLATQSPDGEAGWDWFSQIPLAKMVIEDIISLYHLQMLILTTLFLRGRTNTAWILTGIAIRTVQERGFHQRSTGHSRPTAESELWRRASWVLLVLDTRLSLFLGRPRGTSWQDFYPGPLVECDDEYWEAEDPEQAFKQPEGKPSLISYWNCYCRLMEVVGLAQSTIYSVRRPQLQKDSGLSSAQWYDKTVTELDSALKQWADSVPDHLRWETPHPNDIIFSQSAILYSLYCWVQIQIHRRFIPRPGQILTSLPSLAICTNSARSLVKVCETHNRRRVIPYDFMMIPLFNAVMILTVNLWRASGIRAKADTMIDFDPNEELEWIQRCIDLIQTQESKTSLAGRMVDIIKTVTLVATHNVPPSTSPTQHFIPPNQNESGIDTATEQAQPLGQSQANVTHFNDSSNSYPPFYTNELGSSDAYNHNPSRQDNSSVFVFEPFGDINAGRVNSVHGQMRRTPSSHGSLHSQVMQPGQYYAPARRHDDGQTNFANNDGTINASVHNPSVGMHLADVDMSWPGDPSYVQDWEFFMRNVNGMLQNQTAHSDVA
ncbi:hypothetical protein D9758_005023 [Tetrapyrgos nigripes]|uniref:Xylanolytic transcriptional activator regulatory domain-containing protein n=1 Tax=Tetrapyrgos nigripes TaxID=182062 RepID=A0A8H5LW01_9AGAR|nr:hypothetical protein D9758_005023 [Tetrapyrgos nigripes]